MLNLGTNKGERLALLFAHFTLLEKNLLYLFSREIFRFICSLNVASSGMC